MRAALVSAAHADKSPAGSAVLNHSQRHQLTVSTAEPTEDMPPTGFRLTPKEPGAAWFNRPGRETTEDKPVLPQHSSSGTFKLTSDKIEEINRRLAQTTKSGNTPVTRVRTLSQVSPSGSANFSAYNSGIAKTPKGDRSKLEKTSSQSIDVKFVGGSRVISPPTPSNAQMSGVQRSTSASEVKTLGEVRKVSSALFKLALSDGTDDKEIPGEETWSLQDMLKASSDEYTSIPSCGPQLSRSIGARKSSPFQGRDLKNITPRQINVSMEMAYSTPWERVKSKYFQARAGDVIVVSPPRTGQTPVLQALDLMLHADLTSDFSEAGFASRVGWIESTYATATGPRKLYKSHLSLDHFFSPANESSTEAKVVVVLRDPIAVRQSWFRHVRKVFKHFHPDEAFNFTADDFALVPFMPVTNNSSPDSKRESFKDGGYERFVQQVLKYSSNPNLHIVFYEELLSNPVEVLTKLQQFVGIDDSTKRRLSPKLIARSIDRPDHTEQRAKAVTNALSKATITAIQHRWDFEVATRGPWKLESYAAMKTYFSDITNAANGVGGRKESFKLPKTRSFRKSTHQLFRTSSKERLLSLLKRDSDMGSVSGRQEQGDSPRAGSKSMIASLIRIFEKKKD